VGFPALALVGQVLGALWFALEKLSETPGALWYFPEPGVIALALAMIGAFWLLQPRGVPTRLVGACLLLPLLIPEEKQLRDGAFDAYVLDVGQGLAMIV